MNTCRLFDIQKGSFVDGPGIRTTVFFQGCNLQCSWCHNPESRGYEKHILHYKNRCTGCGLCTEICNEKAINRGNVDYIKCSFCKKCEIYCPNDALKLCGEDYTVESLLDIIKQDKAFYDNSGGGVTFSGGECMLQIDFLCEILKKCKENGIHTAIDTAGNVPWEHFKRILPYADLFLYDVKSIDDETHKKHTGVSNELILNNLKNLFNEGAKIIIRIPIVCGVNDTTCEMEKIKEFLIPYNPQRIELLPYHKLGESKYDAMNLNYMSFDVPDKIKMDKLNDVFRKEIQ